MVGLALYIRPVSIRLVAANLARVARLLGLSMVPPAVAAPVLGEFGQALRFVLIGTAVVGAGMAGRLAGREEMSGSEALVVVALSDLLDGLMGSAAPQPTT